MVKFIDIDTEFFYGKNKNGQDVVVCKLTGYLSKSNRSMPYGIEEIIDHLINNAICTDKNDVYASPDYVFTGKAVLAKGDVFDMDKGKKLAEAKAKKAMFAKECALSSRIICTLMGLTDLAAFELEKRRTILDKEKAHYSELLKTF